MRERRPSRTETRARLLDAAAEVFVARGIALASVEEIAETAGFSRGAFYSNFTDKDELVMALLSRMTDENIDEIESLLDRHPDPNDYIRATQELHRSPQRRRGTHHPVLSVELVLYALRNPLAQPLLHDRLQRTEQVVWRVVQHAADQLGLAAANNRQAIAAMITAMDDGFSLHALIDPTRDPVHAMSGALDFLVEAAAAIAVSEQVGKKRSPSAKPNDRFKAGRQSRARRR